MVVPGRTVIMTAKAEGSKGKTSHAVQLASEPRESGMPDAVVGVHPKLAELIAEQMIHRRLVPEFGAPLTVLKEQTRGNTRVDFVLQYEDGRELLVEVKNCSGADYPTGDVPGHRSHIGVYTSDRQPFRRAAIFPHGTCHKPKIRVVSARAIKQVNELIKFQDDESDEHENVSSAVLIIVNRGDCELFRPCHEACSMFAAMLRRAYARGVLVLAYCVDWDTAAGTCVMGRKLPVNFELDEGSGVDEDWLADILSAEAAMAANRGDMPKDWQPQSEFLTTKIPRNFKPPAMRPKPKPRPKAETEEAVNVKLQPRKAPKSRSKGSGKGQQQAEPANDPADEQVVKVSMKVKTVKRKPAPSGKLSDGMHVEASSVTGVTPGTQTGCAVGAAAPAASEHATKSDAVDETTAACAAAPAAHTGGGERGGAEASLSDPYEEPKMGQGNNHKTKPRKRAAARVHTDQRNAESPPNGATNAGAGEAADVGQSTKIRRVRRAQG